MPTVGASSSTVTESAVRNAPTFLSGCLLGMIAIIMGLPVLMCGGCYVMMQGCRFEPGTGTPVENAGESPADLKREREEAENRESWTIRYKEGDLTVETNDGDEPSNEESSDASTPPE